MEFALEVVRFCHELRKKREYDLEHQLFRSGTSIGANVYESQGAESRSDFIHKLKIAYKEAGETEFWVELCRRSEFLPRAEKLEDQLPSIQKLLGTIIRNSKAA